MRSCRSATQRLAFLQDAKEISVDIGSLLAAPQPPQDCLERMSENVVGVLQLPVSLVPGVCINTSIYNIPCATEEPSVVAALANGFKLLTRGGACPIAAKMAGSGNIIGQVHFKVVSLDGCSPKAFAGFMGALLKQLDEDASAAIVDQLNKMFPRMHERGGGIASLAVKSHPVGDRQSFLTVELAINCQNAMGANFTNTVCEAAHPLIEDAIGKIGNHYFGSDCSKQIARSHITSILSNDSSERVAVASATISVAEYVSVRSGRFTEGTNAEKEEMAGRILARIADLHEIACLDRRRCITHNKGVLNGLEAVCLACGQDTRAVAAANLLLADNKPLTHYKYDTEQKTLSISSRVAVPVGVVGGCATTFPGLSVMFNTTDAAEFRLAAFGEVLASVALAQNMAALEALSTDGIQKGHMRLHQRKLECSNK